MFMVRITFWTHSVPSQEAREAHKIGQQWMYALLPDDLVTSRSQEFFTGLIPGKVAYWTSIPHFFPYFCPRTSIYWPAGFIPA